VKVDALHPTKGFDKLFLALPPRRQAKVKQALNRLLSDPSDPNLRLHQLKGDYAGTFSISAGGDLRVHFEIIRHDDQTIA